MRRRSVPQACLGHETANGGAGTARRTLEPGLRGDAFTDSRRFRILAVVDDFSRRYWRFVADTCYPGLRVMREIGLRSSRPTRTPDTIVGTELTSMAVLRWCQETAQQGSYITRQAHTRRTASWKTSAKASATNC
ncbi:MAG: hypothetical protein H6880_05055 [Rhodobiaceae bacterium]|nr:hypothetical protein [Rhodobiaceae bacterium]